MHEETQPVTDTPAADASLAHEASTSEPPTDAASESPKDDAQVSGPVSSPGVSSIPAPATKKPYVKPRTPAKKAYDDALAAQKKATEAVEAARLKLVESERVVTFQAGMKAIHDMLLRADKGSRESAVAGLEILAVDEEKEVVKNYVEAMNTMPKRVEDQPKKE